MPQEIAAFVSITSVSLSAPISSIALTSVFLPSHPHFTLIALDPTLSDPGKDMSLSEPQRSPLFTRVDISLSSQHSAWHAGSHSTIVFIK